MEKDNRGDSEGSAPTRRAARGPEGRHLCAGRVRQRQIGAAMHVPRARPQRVSPRRVRDPAPDDAAVAGRPEGLIMVETSYGKLQGTRRDGISAYRGIPFARPPLGALRFRAPEPAEKWAGVRDATRYGAAAHQANRPLAPILGMVLPEQ